MMSGDCSTWRIASDALFSRLLNAVAVSATSLSCRVVHGIEEALHVERRDRELVGSRRADGGRGHVRRGRRRRRRRFGQDRVGAEPVVERPDHVGQDDVAGEVQRRRLPAERRSVDAKALGIGVEPRNAGRRPAGSGSGTSHPWLTERTGDTGDDAVERCRSTLTWRWLRSSLPSVGDTVVSELTCTRMPSKRSS